MFSNLSKSCFNLHSNNPISVAPKSAEELELESYLFGDNVTGIVSKPVDSGSVKVFETYCEMVHN
jgi:hypothetical protein